MRDAFGGAFSMKIFIIFLMLYTFFICIALNYAKAFRVKNRIINEIEQQEGYNADVEIVMRSYLIDRAHNIEKEKVESVICENCNFVQPGYSYKLICDSGGRGYYKVETYMVFSVPIIGNLNFPISIEGETRPIDFPNDSDNCW